MDFYQPDKARTMLISEKSVDFVKILIQPRFFPELAGNPSNGRLSLGDLRDRPKS